MKNQFVNPGFLVNYIRPLTPWCGGVAILLVSSELEEVMGLSDRAYLVKNGETINEIIPYKSSINSVLFELFDAKKVINE